MIHRHPNDPTAQHEAAERLGKMVADGLISEESAAHVMGEIVKAAKQNAPTVDASGLRARLVWSASDAKRNRLHARENVAMAVRWACRPLIIAKASKDDTMAAARLAAGDLMTDAEIKAILADEWDRAHTKRRK